MFDVLLALAVDGNDVTGVADPLYVVQPALPASPPGVTIVIIVISVPSLPSIASRLELPYTPIAVQCACLCDSR